MKKTLVKILSIFASVKKKPFRENYRQLLFPSRENTKPTREKILKSVRENFGLPVKRAKKVCVKAPSPSVKKVEKRPKMAFTGTFDFHGEKKTLPFKLHFLFSLKFEKIMIFLNYN